VGVVIHRLGRQGPGQSLTLPRLPAKSPGQPGGYSFSLKNYHDTGPPLRLNFSKIIPKESFAEAQKIGNFAYCAELILC
jgi:hypothetical protein